MKLTVIGCGDAFGSGGRLQTCFHVQSEAGTFLIDCGATAMIGLNRLGFDPNAIGTIFLSHLHGDHFAGLVWFLLHAKHISKRKTPLTIVGPEGTEERLTTASEALFPRSLQVERVYDLSFGVLRERTPLKVGDVTVTPFEVKHFSGAPPFALRFDIDGKVLAFSGDSEWVESLVDAASSADLFICECYQYENASRFHMDYKTIAANLGRIGARRMLLSHMSEAMLAARDKVDGANVLLAEDGLALDI